MYIYTSHLKYPAVKNNQGRYNKKSRKPGIANRIGVRYGPKIP